MREQSGVAWVPMQSQLTLRARTLPGVHNSSAALARYDQMFPSYAKLLPLRNIVMRKLRSFLNRFLGPSVVAAIDRGALRIKFGWLRMVSVSPLLCRVHYLVFSSAFNREVAAVVAGHVEFNRNQLGFEPVNYFLRRAIHRLEKGLLMRPRKEVFALDYIEQAVHAYCLGADAGLDREELAWADSVLERYFQAVSKHPVIEKTEKRFRAARSKRVVQARDSDLAYAPYKRNLPRERPISFDNLMQLAQQRRSVRWYQQKPVPRHLIDKALEIAALSPSACNRQPIEFRIFDDPDRVKKISTLPLGTGGFAHNISAIAVLIGRLRAYPHPRDRHVIYVDGGLAGMSFMYALETLGLSSCPINWPDVNEREAMMNKELDLRRDERVIMLISVGYPDPEGLVAASRKLSLARFRTFPDESPTHGE